MTPIVGDLITIACGAYGLHRDLRVQGVHEASDPADSWCLATGRGGLEVNVAARPNPRHARLIIHETNWALRVLAIAYAVARAVREEENRLVAIRAEAVLARLEWDDTIVEEQEGAV